jgi:hypothetical protein
MCLFILIVVLLDKTSYVSDILMLCDIPPNKSESADWIRLAQDRV